jgi:protein SCO1
MPTPPSATIYGTWKRRCPVVCAKHLKMLGQYFTSICLVLSFYAAIYPGIVYSDKPKSDIQFLVTDQIVLDQNGKEVNFYADLIKHKTFAINFIFTACTSSCPLSTAVFRQVQKKLGNKKVQLITISVDPVNDTPQRLLGFSKKFNAKPNWAFVTGEKTVISGLLKSLGVYTADKNEHSNMVIVGNDATHTWTRLYGFPQADEIITALKNITGDNKNQ